MLERVKPPSDRARILVLDLAVRYRQKANEVLSFFGGTISAKAPHFFMVRGFCFSVR